MRKPILISLLAICIITIQAQDYKFITADTIWVSDTVKIFQNIVIADTSILTINPGVYIEFQGNYSIDVYGKIRAIGAINDSIIFTINDPTSIDDTTTINGGWGGIRFLTNNSDTSILSYCRFSFGKAVVPGVFWGDPNNEDNKGGAIYLKGYAHLVISNSTFYHNRANYRGGGIMTKNCSSIHLLDNTVKYNQVYFTGGGVSIESSSSSIITGNLFLSNIAFYIVYTDLGPIAGGAGGGLSVYCNSIVCNNKFFRNNAVNGAIYESAYNGLIYNNIVSNNMGSGIFNGHSFSISKYFNNTITNNMSYDHIGCGIGLNSDEIKMRNNIVWGNDTSPGWPFDPIQVYPITANFTYGCNPDGYPGEGNITDNPQFVNPTEGAGPDYDGSAADWSLQNSSPCVNYRHT